jgi:hypothetical protein
MRIGRSCPAIAVGMRHSCAVASSSDRLRELVEHAVRAGQPAAALRAMTALREELDAFERLQVARALDAGQSFGDVARAIGISRQAAHRRYRDLATPAPKPALSAEARSALIRAREEATRHGSISIDSTHLLLAISRQRQLGIDVEAARRTFGPPAMNASAPTGLHPALHARLTRDRGPLNLDQLLRAAIEDPDGQRLLARLGVPAQQLLDAL